MNGSHRLRLRASGGKRRTLLPKMLKIAWRARGYWLWPVVANVLGFFSHGHSPLLISQICRRGVLILVGESGFRKGTVPGQDLTRATRSWCSETLGFESILEARNPSDLNSENWQDLSAVVVSYDWLASAIRDKKRAIRSLQLILASWRHRVPVFVMLADTFWIRVAYVANFLTVLTRGSAIVLQNSESEARKYGLRNASAPHFWTWTESKREEWQSSLAWADRPPLALVSATDSKRVAILPEIQARLEELNLQTVATDHSLSWTEYVQLAKSARLVVTTHELQDWFKVVPSPWYRRRLPTHLITGRIWEAFATSSTLITEDSELIRNFGFVPGEHFIELSRFTDKRISCDPAETFENFERVARAGHSHFIEIAHRYEVEMKCQGIEASGVPTGDK